MNVLAIGAHPDDIEIGCFATLAKHKLDGDNIFGVIVTKGEIGGDTEIRRKEAQEAADVIDMQLIFGHFPDGDVRENSELITFLDNLVKKHKIDVIYTHSLNDRHQDHRAVCRASLSVSRNVQEVYCFEAVSLISSFTPQVFVDVTETFGYKISALRKFDSQVERTFVEGLEGIARYRAAQTRLPGRLCEAFEAYKILRNENSPKRLELFDLRNQVKTFKKIISGIESDETNNKLLRPLDEEPSDYITPLSSADSFFDENFQKNQPKPQEIFNKENASNEKEVAINELKKIKEEFVHYKKEMEKVRKEIKGYRAALLLKKEIVLYKEALEKARQAEVKSNEN